MPIHFKRSVISGFLPDLTTISASIKEHLPAPWGCPGDGSFYKVCAGHKTRAQRISATRQGLSPCLVGLASGSLREEPRNAKVSTCHGGPVGAQRGSEGLGPPRSLGASGEWHRRGPRAGQTNSRALCLALGAHEPVGDFTNSPSTSPLLGGPDVFSVPFSELMGVKPFVN